MWSAEFFFVYLCLKFRYLESPTSGDWPKKCHNYVTIWSQLQALRRLTSCLLLSVVVELSERSQVLISALRSPSLTEVNPSSRKGIWLTSAADHNRLLPHLLQLVTHELFFCVIWGFRYGVNKTFSLLECDAAFTDSWLPKFRDNISVLFLSVKGRIYIWRWKQ